MPGNDAANPRARNRSGCAAAILVAVAPRAAAASACFAASCFRAAMGAHMGTIRDSLGDEILAHAKPITKLQMVEALRDPVVQRKYPNLAISKNSIFEK